MKEDKVPIIIKFNYFNFIGDNIHYGMSVWSAKSYNIIMLYQRFLFDKNHDHIGVLNPFDKKLRENVIKDILIDLGHDKLVDLL